MRRDDVRFAAAARDDGIRKISRYTWRAGAAGVACSALIAVAFGHHVAAQQPSSGRSGSSQPSAPAGRNGSQGGGSTIVIPAQPPAPPRAGAR